MTDEEWQQLIGAAAAANGGGATALEDQPIVPLWQTRPPSKVGNAGSSAAADHNLGTSKSTGAGSANAAERAMSDRPAADLDPTSSSVSMSAAEGHWMDMTAEERMAFAAAAEKAGVWKKSLGSDALFRAWAKAVGWAGKYNNLHKDNKRMWMSPFEAITNLAITGLADDDQDHDGFSTEATIQQFNLSQLTSQARQILQNELGRNPTDSEMKAYSAAVNAAARANPQMVTQQQTENPDGSTSTSRVVSGGIDPNEIIQGMAEDTQESDDYKTAAQYLPALQQAISASIHM